MLTELMLIPICSLRKCMHIIHLQHEYERKTLNISVEKNDQFAGDAYSVSQEYSPLSVQVNRWASDTPSIIFPVVTYSY